MLRYPVDEFAIESEKNNWIDDMNKYNLIVVPILNNDELLKTQKALWTHMGPKVTEDYKTWETENWPQPDHPFLSGKYAVDEQAFRNRVHPNLIEVFERLHGTNNLLTTIDHYGVKRGTMFETGERKDWRCKPLKLHWDVNPAIYTIDQKHRQTRYQALIALNDNNQNVGSFACVPGSANGLSDWIEKYKEADNKKYVPNGNPLQFQIQRIPLKAGHAVIWDMGVAHANFSNYSNEPRLAQYVRMLPNTEWAIEKEDQSITKYWQQNPILKASIGKLKWSNREKQILGLKKY